MYRVVLKDKAAKFLRRIPKNQALRITEKLKKLAENPLEPNPQVKPLKGYADTYRLRVGDWRVIYERHDSVLVVEVIKIGARGDVYK